MTERKRVADRGSTKHKFVDVDPDRCIGCGICELVCSLEKSGSKFFNPSKSRIRIMRLYPTLNMAVACRLCEKPSCVRACPKNALVQSIEKGIILVKEGKCDGCGWCIKACEYGAITLDQVEGTAVVCDLCENRKGLGVFPGRKAFNQACIEWCPEEALDLMTRDRLAQKAREAAASRVSNTSEGS